MKRCKGKDFFGTIFPFISPDKKLNKIFRFAFLSLLVALFSYSTAYTASFFYVDNSVASNGNGSPSSPWKNLSNISWSTISSASKPCTIYISGGATSQTYNEQLSIGASGSGIGSEVIVKRPTSTEWPDHSGTVYIRKANGDGTYICGRHYVIIDGLDSRITAGQGSGFGICPSSSYITIRNCVSDNNTSMSIGGGGSYITIQNCKLGPNDLNTGNDTIQYNGDNWTIEYNILQGGWPTGGAHLDGIQFGSGSSSLNTVIRYNIWREFNSAVIAVYDHDMSSGENVSVYIYGNIFEFTDNGGNQNNNCPCILLSGSTAWVKGYIYNNTFVNFTPGGYAIQLGGSNSQNVIDVKNNIFYNSQLRLVGSGTKTSDYNIFYMTGNYQMTNWNGTDYSQSQFASYKSASGQDAHSLNTNPLLTSVSGTLSPNHDLRPTASSPGNNAGIALGSPYNVGLSTNNTKSSWPLSVTTVSRPQGSGWDIGAYEYGASGDSPPQAPQNLRISSQ